jgi:hypothetical protein
MFFNHVLIAKACGPSYLAPVFEFSNAPERPWTDFASGKLGIIKPTHRKIVLFAAYRYLKGGGFSQDEQKDLIDVWEADFNFKDSGETDVTEVVKAWIKSRQSVVKKEETLPAIYVERSYGGYDSFPNCAKNAFEVAKETLENRSSNSEKDVQEWINGQDKVFSNCAGGAELPNNLGQDAPEWLQKDREYQIAAALFYSTKFSEAREKFEKIAEDSDSPWKETADYLVARTLIREASVGTVLYSYLERVNPKSNQLYGEAEQRLNLVMSRSSKFGESAQKMLNLVKYRLRPEIRVRELAQSLEYQTPSLRQDLIDYSWLLDNLEADALKTDKTKQFGAVSLAENIKYALQTKGFADVSVDVSTTPATLRGTVPKGKLAEAILAAQSANGGKPVKIEITETSEIAQTNDSRRDQANITLDGVDINNKPLSNLPTYLREDELSDWLFTYQTDGEDAFLHALERFEQTSSDMWLMTALAKADTTSKDVGRLIKNAGKISTTSAAYPTVAYHTARLLIAQKKDAEARKYIDEVLDSSLDLPISTRNAFAEQRLKLSETLDDFVKFALRKPFAFGYDDDREVTTIDAIIAERKARWTAEYSKEISKADWDTQIDKEFANKSSWQNNLFLDYKAVQSINEYFSTEVLLELLKNEKLPDYWKNRLIPTIWTRAYLLKDDKTALLTAPEVVKLNPAAEKTMLAFINAKTPVERDFAGLDVLLKIRNLTPYFETGFEKQDHFEQEDRDAFYIWNDERWWCESYDGSYDPEFGSTVATFKPKFLTGEQTAKAKLERTKLLKTADAVSYLTKRVFAWSRLSPADKRLPEALYVIYSINHWTKYGCGDYSEDARNKAERLLKTKFPNNKQTLKVFDEQTKEKAESEGSN